LSAGFLALIVVSLSSAWGVLEALGKDNHIRNLLKIYSLESIPAIIVVYLYSYNYSEVLQFATTLLTLAPIVFTVIATILGILVSNKNIMKEHAYSRLRMSIYFLTVALIFIGGIIGVISIT
ncbi:divalent metal cation transporter, partial [Sulfolobus sp. E1]